MANINDKSSKAQKAINSVVAYLHENNQRAYATAVQNAAGRVLTHETGEMRVGNYNKKINRWLTESLFLMNSDPCCPPYVIKTTRKLIEAYREMNGMSTDDFLTDEGDLVVDVDKDTAFSDDVAEISDELENHTDGAQMILDNTEVGETYLVSDIMSYLGQNSDSLGVEEKISEEDAFLDDIKHLVEIGYFEVTAREPFNGKISEVTRVR